MYIDKSYFCLIQGKCLDRIQSRAEVKSHKNLIGNVASVPDYQKTPHVKLPLQKVA